MLALDLRDRLNLLRLQGHSPGRVARDLRPGRYVTGRAVGVQPPFRRGLLRLSLKLDAPLRRRATLPLFAPPDIRDVALAPPRLYDVGLPSPAIAELDEVIRGSQRERAQEVEIGGRK